MNWDDFKNLDLNKVSTPIHIIDTEELSKNISTLNEIQKESGATILLALKAFAQFSVFSFIKNKIKGCTASSLNETKLAYEEFSGEVHYCSPATPPHHIKQIVEMANCIVFNSFRQLDIFLPYLKNKIENKSISIGMRINPEHSEGSVPMYDPCAKNSRLGVTLSEFNKKYNDYKDLISGIHFHTLCEQGYDSLDRTLAVVEDKFSIYFKNLEWINFGGGHLLTSVHYDRQALILRIQKFIQKYKLQVYLEPGEAFVRNTGVLVSRVLDIIPGSLDVVILDTSASAHMPDVLEMPYRPDILDAKKSRELKYDYKLAGLTCLAGDIIADYSFQNELKIGNLIYILDMSHYTMVKNTNFNGVGTPSIAVANLETNNLEIIKAFDYEDYKSRLS